MTAGGGAVRGGSTQGRTSTEGAADVGRRPEYSRNVTVVGGLMDPREVRAETICQNMCSFRKTGQRLEGPWVSLYDRHTFLHEHGLYGRSPRGRRPRRDPRDPYEERVHCGSER
ncbi:hypothetical protein GCM10010448_60280 [Streptomyces glomeratus]|uniref:Uncharacterized protein n=1 Tax=Streptomyces glomeratus TaxID=284452 RepID=A0ABP6M072_9ACTN